MAARIQAIYALKLIEKPSVLMHECYSLHILCPCSYSDVCCAGPFILSSCYNILFDGSTMGLNALALSLPRPRFFSISSSSSFPFPNEPTNQGSLAGSQDMWAFAYFDFMSPSRYMLSDAPHQSVNPVRIHRKEMFFKNSQTIL